MQRKMKSILSVILVAVNLLVAVPVPTFAASGKKLVEARFDCAQVRENAKSSSRLVAWCEQGELMEYISTKYTIFSGKWYKVRYEGKIGYISSEHGKIHTHTYVTYYINDILFDICECGDLTVTADNAKDQKLGNSLKSTAILAASLVKGNVMSSSSSYFAMAPAVAMADGPLIPVGDIIAVGILILGAYSALNTTLPSAETLATYISDVDFDNFLDKNAVACGRDTFRKVERVAGKLRYVDNKCMDKYQAYVYVRILKKDVYTPYEDVALQLAAMHAMQGGAVKFERDKDEYTYFYHYHLGKLTSASLNDFDRVTKGHIFYGTNDLGEMPIE